jgi:hypothetical protein
MEQLYHSHQIRVVTELSPRADCWIPKAEISWEEHGERRFQVLTGPAGFFDIIDEAVLYAVESAKDWVDTVRKKPKS